MSPKKQLLVNPIKILAVISFCMVIPVIAVSEWKEIPPPKFMGLPLHTLKVAMHDNTLIAGTGTGLFYTNDLGLSWTQYDSALLRGEIYNIAITGDLFFVSIYDDLTLYQSFDAGENWTKNDSIFDFISSMEEDIYSLDLIDGVLYVGTCRNGVYRSADSGKSWVVVDTLSSGTHGMVKIDNRIFTANYGINKSQDNGFTWELLETDLPSMDVYDFISVGNRLYAAIWEGAYYSVDGLNWKQINSGLPQGEWDQIDYITAGGTSIFVTINNKGIYFTRDSGSHWEQETDSIYLFDDSSITWEKTDYDSDYFSWIEALNDSLLFGGNYYHLFYKNISGLGSGNEQRAGHIPTPHNDFGCIVTSGYSSTLTVSVFLRLPGTVNFSVFDLSGKRVESHSFENTSPGKNTFHLNTRHIRTGCYTLSVEAPGRIYRKKVHFIR